jgi:Sigma-70, region 4
MLTMLERRALTMSANDCGHREIGSALGVRQRAVNNTLQRARGKLMDRADVEAKVAPCHVTRDVGCAEGTLARGAGHARWCRRTRTVRHAAGRSRGARRLPLRASRLATSTIRRDRSSRSRCQGRAQQPDRFGGSGAPGLGGEDAYRRRVEAERFDVDVLEAGF